jgi:ubiquitin carboxyl-terminal hydrolase 4/11/15
LRLDDSSRNGSSSAFVAGAGALRGGGLGGAGSLASNGAVAEMEDDELPMYSYQQDEGYAGGLEDDMSLGMVDDYPHGQQQWSFAKLSVPGAGDNDVFHGDDGASDRVDAGSPIEDRMHQFDHDDLTGDFEGLAPGQSTPLGQDEASISLLAPSDDEVVDIKVDDD